MQFPSSNPIEKIWAMKDQATELTIQDFEPKSQISLEMIAQKWHACDKLHYLYSQWTDSKN